MHLRCSILLGWILAIGPATAEEIPISGKIPEPTQIGAIGIIDNGTFLVIASDKGNAAQVLKQQAKGGGYEAWGAPVTLLVNPEKPEFDLDIEAIACMGRTVYLAGSHSYRRKRVLTRPGEPERTYAENRIRLAATEHQKRRDHVFRFELNAEGRLKPGSLQSINLRHILSETEHFRRLAKVPGRENGVNIEGIAVDKQGNLYIGFRSPVLRGNFVPVLVLSDFNSYSKRELRFVDLDGHGIRGMATTASGKFLLIAGPVGDRNAASQIYLWDGKDMIPGTGSPGGQTSVLVRDVPAPGGSHAEGIAILSEDRKAFHTFVVFDGAKNGGCTKLAVPKAR